MCTYKVIMFVLFFIPICDVTCFVLDVLISKSSLVCVNCAITTGLVSLMVAQYNEGPSVSLKRHAISNNWYAERRFYSHHNSLSTLSFKCDQ